MSIHDPKRGRFDPPEEEREHCFGCGKLTRHGKEITLVEEDAVEKKDLGRQWFCDECADERRDLWVIDGANDQAVEELTEKLKLNGHMHPMERARKILAMLKEKKA